MGSYYDKTGGGLFAVLCNNASSCRAADVALCQARC